MNCRHMPHGLAGGSTLVLTAKARMAGRLVLIGSDDE